MKSATTALTLLTLFSGAVYQHSQAQGMVDKKKRKPCALSLLHKPSAPKPRFTQNPGESDPNTSRKGR